MLTLYWKAKQAQLPKYLSKVLPELSEGANKYAIRHSRLQPPVHKHEYIKITYRYQLALLFNEISVWTERIVKSCLVQNYSHYRAISNMMFISFTPTELFNKCDVNYVLQCKL